jgi:hypothetical protein
MVAQWENFVGAMNKTKSNTRKSLVWGKINAKLKPLAHSISVGTRKL